MAELRSADEVCQILSDSYKDFILEEEDDKDYLSFSTILDVYLSKPQDYSDEDNIKIIDKLTEIFDSDHELVYEIGWDIPTLLLDYFPCKLFFFHEMLANNKKLASLFKLFNLLARYGNAKELFLKSAEIFNSLNFNDNNDFIDRVPIEYQHYFDDESKEKFLNLKFHSLFELHVACLKRITTMYPSKFLLMTVTSVLKYLNNNAIYLVNPTFALKRIYIFSRDYVQPQLPDDFDPEHNKDHAQIVEDENYLQGRLLKHFITNAIEIACKYFKTDLATSYYQQLIEKSLNMKFQLKNQEEELEHQTEYESISRETFNELMERYYQLGLSEDVDFTELFQDYFIKTTHNLFDKLLNSDVNNNEKEDELTKQIFDISNEFFFQNLSGVSLPNRDVKRIPLSIIGCFMLISYNNLNDLIESNFEKLNYKLSVQDSILLTLRFLIPVLTLREQTNSSASEEPSPFEGKLEPLEGWPEYNRNLKRNRKTHYQSLKDAIVLWVWLAIADQTLKDNEVIKLTSLSSKYRIFSKVFLQSLISLVAVFQDDLNFRKIVLTYVTRFLSLSDETFAWEFLLLSLENCPYLNAKIELLNILKDMVTRKKVTVPVVTDSVLPANGAISDISHQMKKINIDDNSSSSTTPTPSTATATPTPQPPQLPPRLPPREYISLDAARKQKILELLNDVLFDIFGEAGSESTIVVSRQYETDYFQLLLTYLNLVFVLREKFNESELQSLHKKINECLVNETPSSEDTKKPDTKNSKEEKVKSSSNNIALLELFNQQLKAYIKA